MTVPVYVENNVGFLLVKYNVYVQYLMLSVRDHRPLIVGRSLFRLILSI